MSASSGSSFGEKPGAGSIRGEELHDGVGVVVALALLLEAAVGEKLPALF